MAFLTGQHETTLFLLLSLKHPYIFGNIISVNFFTLLEKKEWLNSLNAKQEAPHKTTQITHAIHPNTDPVCMLCL
jgi:hypothetical protein